MSLVQQYDSKRTLLDDFAGVEAETFLERFAERGFINDVVEPRKVTTGGIRIETCQK